MKNEIRKKQKLNRKNFGETERQEADRAILKTFIEAFSKYDSFFIYNSFSTEARTDLIIEELVKAGKRVYLPRVEGENIVAVPYVKDGFKVGAFGISEPTGQAFEGEIDITLVPLLAVNSKGFRIGYGGGFYDRYLRGKNTQKVGMGYFFQLEDFEEEPHDVPLDKYLCERGIFNF
ncbi:MAG: 5-formyltetrahydrofolate cyclo-ligase [Clostridiales bacterium]|nr:5-formyltetrahydrofolate cyclo-ligase [Clostridiales bacterium]